MRKKHLSLPVFCFLAAICFAVFVPSMGQYQLSAISYLLIEKFQLTDLQYSQIFTAVMLPGAALSLVAGILGDRLGVIKCCTAAVLIATVCGVARVFAASYPMLLLCTAATGVSCTFLAVNTPKILGYTVTPEKRSRTLGFILGGSPAGTCVGMAITARAFHSVDSVFVSLAVLLVLVVAVWAVALWLLRREPEVLSSLEARGEGRREEQGMGKTLAVAVKSPVVWRIALCLFLFQGFNFSVSSFLPLALQEKYGLSASSAGLISSFILFGTLTGYICGAPILSMLKGKKVFFISIAPIACILGILGVLFIQNPVLRFLCALVDGFFGNVSFTSLMTLPVNLPEIGADAAGTANGFITSVGSLGCVLIPPYVIAPLAVGYEYKVLFAAVCPLLSAVVLLSLRKTLKQYLY